MPDVSQIACALDEDVPSKIVRKRHAVIRQARGVDAG